MSDNTKTEIISMDSNIEVLICHDCGQKCEDEEYITIKELNHRVVCCDCMHDYNEFLEGER